MVSDIQQLVVYFDDARQCWVAEGMAFNPTAAGAMVLSLDFRGSNAITIAAGGTIASLSRDVQETLVRKVLNDVVDAVIRESRLATVPASPTL
jgi:hypothetical protein